MNILKQLSGLQAKMSKIQEELGSSVFDGSSGNGLVSISVNGRGEVKSLKILPAALSEDADLVSDLVVSAFNDAMSKKEAKSKELLATITPGMAGTGLNPMAFLGK